MKKLFLLFVSICIAISVQAQNRKTLHLTEAGTLSEILTDEEKQTITDLTITGNMDAIDFQALYSMKVSNVDLSAVTILNYEGYNANEMPLCIDYDKFAFRSSLISIKLPNSITKIKAYTFSNYKNLKEVIIPNSVDIIEWCAFEECDNLKSVTLSNKLTSIGCFAFMDCTSLYSIVFPSTLKTIMEGAFINCSNLHSIVIPNSVTSIGNRAFIDCNNLRSIHFPASVDEILNVMYDCKNLRNISIDTANKNYSCRDGILYNKQQTTLYICPASKKGKIKIPNSVTTIFDYAFYDCEFITSINIPSSVISIGVNAFKKSGISSIYIPRSVTNIDKGVFSFCKKLTAITVDTLNEAYSSNDGVLYDKLQTTLLYCPNHKKGELMIPHSVTNIGSGSFVGCNSLKIITIPNSVRIIEAHAFVNFKSLYSISIPNSVITIDTEAFKNCHNLSSIVIPNSVSSIGNGAFENCTSLRSIKISNSVTAIKKETFYRCKSLFSVDIPNSVKSIGERSFANCYDLHTISIPNSVDTIDVYAFDSCNCLTSIFIPSSVKAIETCFETCSNLSMINVDTANTNYLSIDGVLYNKKQTALIKCPKNQNGNLIIPRTVVGYRIQAFDDCTFLQSIRVMNPIPIEVEDYIPKHVKFYVPLYVPKGSKAAYAASYYWGNFVRIIENEE